MLKDRFLSSHQFTERQQFLKEEILSFAEDFSVGDRSSLCPSGHTLAKLKSQIRFVCHLTFLVNDVISVCYIKWLAWKVLDQHQANQGRNRIFVRA